MHRVFFKAASIFAALSVLFGAFGAHLLKKHLSTDDLNSFHTAVNYQMTHALGIFIVGMLYRHYKKSKIVWAGYFFSVGILFFSGSIYLRLLFNFMSFELGRQVILLAPLGGVLFIFGWIFILLSVPAKTRYVENSKGEG